MNLTNQQLSPQKIIIDFELSIINALRAEFPASDLAGCYFHFAQCLWCHVQHLGLGVGYMADHQLKYVIRKTMALGFIPLQFVGICHTALLAHPLTIQMLQVYPALQMFLDYFADTWMNQNGSFPPALWNVHSRRMEFRTNNSVESFHNRWNQAIGFHHPSLWVFLRALKDEQAIQETRVAEMLNGNPAPRRRRMKWRHFETRIRTLKAQLQNGALTMDGYWRAIRRTVHEFSVV